MSRSLRKAVQLYIQAMHFAVIVSYFCRVRIDRMRNECREKVLLQTKASISAAVV